MARQCLGARSDSVAAVVSVSSCVTASQSEALGPCCQATLFVRGIASNFVRLSGRAAIPPASFALLPQRGREQGSSFSKAPLPPLHLCLLSLLLFIPLNTVTHTSRYFSPPLNHPILLQLGLHCIENPDVCATTCTKLVPCFFGGSAPDSLPFQYKACPTSPP